MEKLLTLLYGASGVAAVALYLPQISTYHRDLTARRSISLLSWGGWLALAGITILYALYVISNPLIAGIAALNVLAQATVLFYGVRSRLASTTPASTPAPVLAPAAAPTPRL